jgi:predicted membrane channel-forming protein YqfA (hemolysin III family)
VADRDPVTLHRVLEVTFYLALGALWAWIVKILTRLDNSLGFWLLIILLLALVIGLLITRENNSGSSS